MSDTILGLGGDDIIIGNGGDDIIDGGAGSDILLGSGDFGADKSIYYEWPKANGNDTYIFGRGYGHDTIIDGDTTPNIDRLQFKDDISPADLAVTREGLDLVLAVKDSDDRVTLQKYFAESSDKEVAIHPYEIEEIEFADATVWSSATIRDLLLAGSDNAETIIGYKDDDVITGLEGDDTIEGRSGDDILHGGGGDDTIRAGLGSDLIEGGAGNDLLDGNGNGSGFSDGWLQESVADDDTYVFGEGDGHDIIVDYDWRSGNMDTLRFKEDVAVDELFFERIDNSTGDLKIVLGDAWKTASQSGTGSAITLISIK